MMLLSQRYGALYEIGLLLAKNYLVIITNISLNFENGIK